ncbi:DNA-binding transcriptional repressor MngR [Streptomyces turgidiscabies]|nr:DNA-binding transcriptional repressor MngR [Streptomyces turgidiscabies]
MRAVEESVGPVRQPDTERSAAPGTLPEWRRILQEAPAWTPGVWLTGQDAEVFRALVTQSYQAGGTIRGISEVIARSYSSVYTALDQAGVLRPRGKPVTQGLAAHRPSGEYLQPFVERVIRERISDGTYPRGKRLPPGRSLAQEFGVSPSTVHEALKTLRQERVLERADADTLGTWVSPPDPPQ